MPNTTGELLQTLTETGLDQNTIIVFTSDHGDMIESHGQKRKQRPWEESARVPMLFRLPEALGIHPRRVDGAINSEDLMPTLLGLCGRPIPNSVEGFNFTGYLRGGEDPSGGATIIRCITPFGEFPPPPLSKRIASGRDRVMRGAGLRRKSGGGF